MTAIDQKGLGRMQQFDRDNKLMERIEVRPNTIRQVQRARLRVCIELPCNTHTIVIEPRPPVQYLTEQAADRGD